MKNITQLDPSQLLDDKTFQIRPFDEQTVKQIADGIQERGQIQPVIYRKTGDHLQLIAGFQRTAACIEAKMPVEAIEITADDKQALIVACEENMSRKTVSGFEQFICIMRLCEAECTHEDISKIMRIKDPSWISSIKRIGKFPELVESLKNGELKLSQCALAAKNLNPLNLTEDQSKTVVPFTIEALKELATVPDTDTMKGIIEEAVSKNAAFVENKDSNNSLIQPEANKTTSNPNTPDLSLPLSFKYKAVNFNLNTSTQTLIKHRTVLKEALLQIERIISSRIPPEHPHYIIDNLNSKGKQKRQTA